MNPNALIPFVNNGLTKIGTNAAEKAVQNAITNSITKAVTKGLTGAGISTLAPHAGSTLDGILGKSSGLVLPQATPTTFKDHTGLGSLGEAIYSGEIEPGELSTYGIKPDTRNQIKDVTRAFAEDTGILSGAANITAKTQLPKIKTSDYIRATGLHGKDIPSYMKNYLSEKNGLDLGDSSWAEVFPQFTNNGEGGTFVGTPDDILGEYEKLLDNTASANEIYTPKNMSGALAIDKELNDKATQEATDFLGNKRNIKIAGGSGPTRKIEVGRPTLSSTEADAVNKNVINPELASQIEDLKLKLGSAGGNGGNNVPPTTAAPADMPEGFKIRLNTGENVDINLGNRATRSTAQQRGMRNLNDITAKGMNASAKQYKDIVGKSNSIDGYYKSVAERIRAERIDQANVAEKAGQALALREEIKQEGLRYAEENGIMLDLRNVDNTIGLSTTQRKKLEELGLGLDAIMGNSGVVTPTQAEEIYKTLRDYAYQWSDSKDALTKVAGNACQKEAEAVRDIIDTTMDNLNIDYKTSLIEEASKNGEDPKYLRKLAEKSDFKFSDLRKDQSDWLKINDLSGNKMKDNPTINVAGIDTGIPNPLKGGADKVKEEYYKHKAYGGGNGGGNGGTPNNINFTGGDGEGRFSGILNSSKLKNAGLIGGGVLGGLLLGGGGGGSDDGGVNELEGLGANNAYTGETVAQDPYYGMTLGGYSHDQLEQGYVNAIMAGDTKAASVIAQMIEMLESKVSAYSETNATTTSSMNSGLNALSELYELYKTAGGSQGVIRGNATNLLNSLTGGGYNSDVAAYEAMKSSTSSMIIRALGEKGTLSDKDRETITKALPNITDSPEVAKKKFQALYNMLMAAQ